MKIPEIDIKVDIITVTPTMRKLKAKWTSEMTKDINDWHHTSKLDRMLKEKGYFVPVVDLKGDGYDSHHLFTKLASAIHAEIDNEILNDLVKSLK